jgi:hypothetical protein
LGKKYNISPTTLRTYKSKMMKDQCIARYTSHRVKEVEIVICTVLV